MKSQSEILGLALIVVLIFLGLVIYVRFALTSDQNVAIPAQLMYKQLPVVLNDVLLQTNIQNCNNEQLRNVIMRCVEGQQVCGTYNTCEYARNWTIQKLNETLGEWRFAYIYNITVDGNTRSEFPAIFGRNCTRKNIDTEVFPSRLAGRLFEARLSICH
jgi:hypothetical protein